MKIMAYGCLHAKGFQRFFSTKKIVMYAKELFSFV